MDIQRDVQFSERVGNERPKPQDKKERLIILENEISQAEKSLESDCASYISEQITPEMEDLFFENKKAFVEQIFTMQNNFLRENFNNLIKERDELKGQILEDEAYAEIDKAKAEFLAKNPNVNFDDLMDFYSEDVGPRYKKVLEKMPPNEFFETLKKIYDQKTQNDQKSQNQNDYLPRNINGNADVDNVNFDYEENPMSRM